MPSNALAILFSYEAFSNFSQKDVHEEYERTLCASRKKLNPPTLLL
jgi:hypothetical protein